MFHSDEKFELMVDAMPLVSVDLIIYQHDSVLLGRRLNRPAKGYWFVPGGRVMKNETIVQALARVLDKELSIATLLSEYQIKPNLLGVYEHFYGDSFSGDKGISTHYVVLGHQIDLPNKIGINQHDNQHDELRWWGVDELLNSDEVHPYTKNYFLK